MDISQLKPHLAELDLLLPGTKTPIGLTLYLRSMSDDHVRKVQDEVGAEQRAIIEAGQEVTTEQRQAYGRTIYASTIARWIWAKGASWDGKRLDCNLQNAELVLSQQFIFDQVLEVHANQGRFFAQYATNPPITSETVSSTPPEETTV